MNALSFYEWQHICADLNQIDIINLTATCHHMHEILKPITTNMTSILKECIKNQDIDTWQMQYANKYIFRVKIYNFQLHNTYYAFRPFDVFSIALMKRDLELLELLLKYYNPLINEIFEFGWRKTPNWDIVSKQQKIVKRCITNNWMDGFKLLCKYLPARLHFIVCMTQDMCSLEYFQAVVN